MSEITVTLKLRAAAAMRDALYRTTIHDSYEFPSERTIEIREGILALDEKIGEIIGEVLNDSKNN